MSSVRILHFYVSFLCQLFSLLTFPTNIFHPIFFSVIILQNIKKEKCVREFEFRWKIVFYCLPRKNGDTRQRVSFLFYSKTTLIYCIKLYCISSFIQPLSQFRLKLVCDASTWKLYSSVHTTFCRIMNL